MIVGHDMMHRIALNFSVARPFLTLRKKFSHMSAIMIREAEQCITEHLGIRIFKFYLENPSKKKKILS